MILGSIVAAILLAIVLCLVTLVQLFYLESLRLRTRDLPSLQFFKDSLQDRLGARDQAGVLVFSLIKHTSLLLLVVCFIAASASKGTLGWIDLAQDTLFAWLTMLLSTYVLPQLLYRKTSGHWLVPLVPVLRAIALVVRPLAALLGFFQSLVDLAQQGQAEVVQSTNTEHIEALINAGEEEGIIEKEDRKLIHSVVAFGDKTVREVMTPRPDIIAIEASRSLEDLRELV
ncbi:MAG: HlyC/CorC family transporter, partial [Acidobacteriota bacterium]|nr:HlyC/CorC family transporter [Acidobacteriota bacterium]